MQPIAGDRWYYYDEHHWYIKAPDMWQHLMGSYASTKVLKVALEDDLSAAAAVLIGGVLKEVDDAMREGWSVRDLIMDLVGVSAAVLDTPRGPIPRGVRSKPVSLYPQFPPLTAP